MGLAFSAYVLPYAGYPYAAAPVVAYAPLGKQKDISTGCPRKNVP